MERIGSANDHGHGTGSGIDQVLVIDDSPAIRQALAENLRKVGIRESQLTTLESGDEAMRRFSKLQPDLVFLDTSMPDVDPYDATQAILFEAPDTKVVAITGKTLEDPAVQSLLEFGVFDVIRKPLRSSDVDQLFNAIREEQSGRGRIR